MPIFSIRLGALDHVISPAAAASEDWPDNHELSVLRRRRPLTMYAALPGLHKNWGAIDLKS